MVCADKPIGVFADSNTNAIQYIDPITQTVSDSYLKGELGSYGGGLFDVVITPNGKTAIVSNFGDSTIYFIDISKGFEEPPTLLGDGQGTYIGFFAEDMEITPDGKYVLVTDGGFSARVAIVEISSGLLVSSKYLGANIYANAVTISPDGTLVLFADYFQGAVHSFALSGITLTYIETQRILPVRPVNVAISPDGQTVIVANAGASITSVFLIDSQQNLCHQGTIPLPSKNGQSCIFSKDGSKIYYLSNSQNGGTRINVLNVTAPGKVSASGTSISLYPPKGTSQLFGVDSIAMDPAGNYLYVANPTLSGGLTGISIIDLTTETEVGFVVGNGIPTGIAFTTTADDEE
jgi:DNA-binding beta-propeller fold protein YncE